MADRFRKKPPVDWKSDLGVKRRVGKIIDTLALNLDKERIYTFRSHNAKTRALARIWGLPRIWQLALNLKPGYIIEVISEKFDKLDEIQKDKVLVHELVHIPKTFSGSLRPHTRKHRHFDIQVTNLFNKYRKTLKNET